MEVQCLEDIHPQLGTDIEEVKRIFGEDAIAVNVFESIGEADVDLFIPLTSLRDQVANDWMVDKNETLVIRHHFSLSQYIDSIDCPVVEVVKPEEAGGVTFRDKVQRCLQAVLLQNWKGSDKKIQNKGKIYRKVHVDPFALIDNDCESSDVHINIISKETDKDVNEKTVSKLNVLHIGFDKLPVIQALEKIDDCNYKYKIINNLVLLNAEESDKWYVKEEPSNHVGFLAQVYDLITRIIPDLHEQCVMCSKQFLHNSVVNKLQTVLFAGSEKSLFMPRCCKDCDIYHLGNMFYISDIIDSVIREPHNYDRFAGVFGSVCLCFRAECKGISTLS